MFDSVFDSTQTQEGIFRKTRVDFLVGQVLTGFHATILAYGQTGSGKTFTMDGLVDGHPTDRGIIPRAITELFAQVERRRAELQGRKKITIKVQYVQIYNEKVYDLLVSKSQRNTGKTLGLGKGLKVKIHANSEEVTIENVYNFDCNSEEEAQKYFQKGLGNKTVAAHNLNQASSRAHSILTFIVHQEDLQAQNDSDNIISKLRLVDLAGSERQSNLIESAKSTVNEAQFREAIGINKSLFTLRQVITALTENASRSLGVRKNSLESELGGNSSAKIA